MHFPKCFTRPPGESEKEAKSVHECQGVSIVEIQAECICFVLLFLTFFIAMF